mmetsp:Transcript_15039/g.32798  ORF Transcript_15039/g.32798 Transcript_15039/m.32798 type:complete len:80 (+) Transcript_15039:587-826(+)
MFGSQLKLRRATHNSQTESWRVAGCVVPTQQATTSRHCPWNRSLACLLGAFVCQYSSSVEVFLETVGATDPLKGEIDLE